jgi:hypothetical protein
MEPESIKWVMSQGIGAVLAFVMFLVYRKDVHNALNSWRDQTKILTALVQDVSTSIKGNTDAVLANTDAVAAMERQLPHACPMAETLADGAVSKAVAASRGARMR